MNSFWIYPCLILAAITKYGELCIFEPGTNMDPLDVKEKVYRAPIVMVVENTGRDPTDDEIYYMKIHCIFKHYGAPALTSDSISVWNPGTSCAETYFTEGEKILLTLEWENLTFIDTGYTVAYGDMPYGSAAYPYTPELMEEVFSVCGMRHQVQLPPGGQSDDFTCPVAPSDPYDCTIPRLRDGVYVRPPKFDAMQKCPGLRKIIDDGLKNLDIKRDGKPPPLTLTNKMKTSTDFCVLPERFKQSRPNN